MSRPPMTSIMWTRNCSALEIFALNGVALKSASTRTLFARSSATMGYGLLKRKKPVAGALLTFTVSLPLVTSGVLVTAVQLASWSVVFLCAE